MIYSVVVTIWRATRKPGMMWCLLYFCICRIHTLMSGIWIWVAIPPDIVASNIVAIVCSIEMSVVVDIRMTLLFRCVTCKSSPGFDGHPAIKRLQTGCSVFAAVSRKPTSFPVSCGVWNFRKGSLLCRINVHSRLNVARRVPQSRITSARELRAGLRALFARGTTSLGQHVAYIVYIDEVSGWVRSHQTPAQHRQNRTNLQRDSGGFYR